MHEAVDDEVGQVRLGKRRADFDHEIARRSATGLLGGYAKEPKELAEDLKVWKVDLEKQIACVETNETKMMERADQEAHQQNLWDRILRSTAAPVVATALAREVTTVEALATISTRSCHFVAGGGLDGHR